MYQQDTERHLTGVEAVIDKDLASGLLAQEINADLFIMATDGTEFTVTGENPLPVLSERPRRGSYSATCFPQAPWDPKWKQPAHSSKKPVKSLL
jgi:carbamate kinase